jgi:hypothetical protein
VLYIYSLWILDLGICGECNFVRWQRRQTRSVSVHKKDEMLQFLETFGQSSVEAFWRFSHGFVVVSMPLLGFQGASGFGVIFTQRRISVFGSD